MKVVFPRFTFCMGCTNNILHVPFHWQRRFTSSSKMSLGDRLWKTQNLMFFLQFQFWNHRFAIAKHQISSWSHGPATRNSCASTSGLFKSTTNSAFQVPELRITKKRNVVHARAPYQPATLFFNLVETHGTWNGLICVLLHTKVARTGTVLVAKQPGIIIRTAVGTLLPNTLLGKQVAKGICGTKLNLIFLMISSLRFLRLH